ncbi:choline/ethanolaminephosphotransferase 1-like [Haliotis cracherodii]|uniref:choline/ethanolaminephosphotransferase 1-like n=1 Tax=Haliotis cracherodii TaxID=6455 RepID=UPI0039ED1F3E
MMEVLTSAQLKRLSEHKYSSEGTSILEPPMQVFWRWLIEQIPTTWAPNTLTIVGLFVNILSTLLLVYYSPDAKQDVPSWAYFMCGLGLFVYQSLDAIDGKQARRTKSNTPLGELFDHGCDSVSTVFVMLGVSIAMKLGKNPGWMLFENLTAMFLFYCAHWQAYVCGKLRFGPLDVTEGQFTVMFVHLVSTVMGDSFWDIQIPILGIEMKILVILFSLLGAAAASYRTYLCVMKGGVGKNGSTVAGTSTIFPMFPIVLAVVLGTLIQAKSPTHVFERHPCLYIVSFGLLAAKVTNRLVVANMTKSEMNLLDSGLIGPGLMFLNQYFNNFFNEYFLLWICCLYVTVDLVKYSYIVCQEICDYLGIYCFTITSKPPPKSSTNGKEKKS